MNKDRDHPFLRPLWRRVALVAVCAIWSAIEFATGNSFWGTMAGALGFYAAWQYLYLWQEPAAAPPADIAPPSDPAPPDTKA